MGIFYTVGGYWVGGWIIWRKRGIAGGIRSLVLPVGLVCAFANALQSPIGYFFVGPSLYSTFGYVVGFAPFVDDMGEQDRFKGEFVQFRLKNEIIHCIGCGGYELAMAIPI